MKKLVICLSIICAIMVSIGKIAYADEFGDAMQRAFQELKQQNLAYYKNIGNCTPGSYQDGMLVIQGQNGGYCIIKQYMKVNNQKHPYKECKMPMNEARAYAQEKINELENDGFSYNSSTDKLNNYCTHL